MRKDKIRQIVVVVATLVTLVVNYLANALPLNGKGTGEISDSFDVYFVPAGYVFSIWGLIYLGMLAYTIYQALPAQRENLALRRIGYLYAGVSAANVAWIFLWHYEVFPLTIVAMLAILACLIAIYLRLGVGRVRFSPAPRWLVRVPFQIYLGWITVATVANVTSLLDYLNWDGFGIAPVTWAVIMLIAAAAIAAGVSLTRGDVAYVAVIVWAFIGIAVKHADTGAVATTAWVTAALVALSLLVGVPRSLRRVAGSAG